MKSNWNDKGIYAVQVEGPWTISNVQEHLQEAALHCLEISSCALQFAERNHGAQISIEFDLSGITLVDASGWRVLMLWLEHLQHQGFNPVVQ